MNVSMTDFDYYFTVTGGEGGLFSLDLRFAIHVGRDGGDASALARSFFDTHTGVYDRLLEEVLDGKRDSLVTDSAGRQSAGYSYSGKPRPEFAGAGEEEARRRLSCVFGDMDFDFRGDNAPAATRSATIKLTTYKREDGVEAPKIGIEYQMGHTLNACFYRLARSLREVEVEPAAQRGMDNLEAMLAQGWEREGRDHFKALVGEG